MAGAAVVALVIAVLSLSVVLAPGRGGPVPAFAATPPVLHTTSTGESAGTVLGRLARVARADAMARQQTCAGSAMSGGHWPTGSTVCR